MKSYECPVFKDYNEARMYCRSHTKKEKRKLFFLYYPQKNFWNSKQTWGAPSVYYLQYILNSLYIIEEAFVRYDNLNSLEKHGLAHLIVALSAPYVENQKEIILAVPNSAIHEYIIYISTEYYIKKHKEYYRIKKFIPATSEKCDRFLRKNLCYEELKKEIQSFCGCDDFILYEKNYTEFDPDNINYFGNYIHDQIKKIMRHQEEWKKIKVLRNRLAHPHEGISELDLRRVCKILCSSDFILDIEALVFLLSPLSLEDRQSYCKRGIHNNRNGKVVQWNGLITTNLQEL